LFWYCRVGAVVTPEIVPVTVNALFCGVAFIGIGLEGFAGWPGTARIGIGGDKLGDDLAPGGQRIMLPGRHRAPCVAAVINLGEIDPDE
jgi:hypothetical protein